MSLNYRGTEKQKKEYFTLDFWEKKRHKNQDSVINLQ